MAGKLEIRVVPKEPPSAGSPPSKEAIPRPQNLSPPDRNGLPPPSAQNNVAKQEEGEMQTKESPPPPARKIERTKSILKQSSKERNEQGEPLPSPKKEQITFAPEALEKETEKVNVVWNDGEVDQETQCDAKRPDETAVETADAGTVTTSDKQTGRGRFFF